MAIGWHYERDGEQHGPVEFDQLKRMASSGLLRDHDLVWSEGMSGWDQASRISGLFSPKTAEWYFAVGGERFGPVFLDDLKQFAIGGRLLPSDLVWSQGEPNWKPAAEVPSLINDLRHGEATPASKGKIQRIKELAASDESRMIMERTKNAASDISGKVREVAKKAKDYASSDDAKELLDKAKRNISDVTEKIVHSERTKVAVEFASTIPEKWRENSAVLGLPMKDWGYLASLLVLAAILKLTNAATSGYLVVYFMCSLWVYRDARERLNSPVGWSAGSLLAGFLVMPAYIALRNLKDGETREGGRSWNILKSFAIFWSITMAIAAFGYLGATSEIGSIARNDFQRAGVTNWTGIGFMIIVALWFFPMVAALILGFFLKKSSTLERGPTGALVSHSLHPPLGKVPFIGIGFLVVVLMSVTGLRSDDPVDNIRVAEDSRFEPIPRGSGIGGSSALREVAPPGQGSIDLPPEIGERKVWPDVPLLKMPIQLSLEVKDSSIRPSLFFSPQGKHAIVVFDRLFKLGHGDGHDVRLWDVATGEQLAAKAEGCDYFSLPAAFSPDESRIACVDGDFLRIWDLKSKPAALVQSLSLVPLSQRDDRPKHWNGVLWSKEDTLILSLGTVLEKNRCFQIFRRTGSGLFSPLGTMKITPSIYKKKSIWFGTVSVSPDGRFVASAVEPHLRSNEKKYLAIQIVDAESGSEVKEIVFPDTGYAIGRSALDHLGLRMEFEPNTSSFKDPGSCLDFSPDGEFLLVETLANQKRSIKVLKTGTLQMLSQLDLGDDKSNDGRFPGSFIPSCFSRDGGRLAGFDIRKTRTSRGEKTERVALVFELATGKRIQQIALGDEFTVDEMTRGNRADQEKLTFSLDGQSLVVTVINKDHYSDANRRSEAAWSVGSWELADGRNQFVLSGLLLGSGVPKSVKMAPGGRIVATQVENRLQVWDIPRLVRLRAELDEGDKSWSSGDHTRAFDHYCSVLAESMSWFVGDRLPYVYSRCVDTYAERGEAAKGRLLVTRASQSKIALSPESPQGRKLIEEFEAEQVEARRQESEQRRLAATKRLAEIRAKNQASRVVARALTKQQFIDKLRQNMSQGRIDNLVTYAIFENHSFEDTFGEPDSNVEWVNHQRLVSYRCRDGSLSLAVMYLGSKTILQGINQY